MFRQPAPVCGHCDGPHAHNDCPAVARMEQAETECSPSERRRVKIRKYGSLPSMAYWSAYDADDDTQQPLLPSYTGRRKRDVVQIATNNGWEIVR